MVAQKDALGRTPITYVVLVPKMQSLTVFSSNPSCSIAYRATGLHSSNMSMS